MNNRDYRQERQKNMYQKNVFGGGLKQGDRYLALRIPQRKIKKIEAGERRRGTTLNRNEIFPLRKTAEQSGQQGND